ncbi:Hypothetical protein R9X50_00742600 [Acrodontium crateriforme]|uniref:ABC transporter domain-containing protein n=1 Tax=Acrodontium crateriforme TaxID=150365 RepID=A0AAQ3MA59_9PEZI|nr:Hypothetical protein R9X50_00742600 [Acrodontium crateriforme]
MWRGALMKRAAPLLKGAACRSLPSTVFTRRASSVVEIKNATFYRSIRRENEASTDNPALFPNLTFDLPSDTPKDGYTSTEPQYWSVISASSIACTTFLQCLAGQHYCEPITARRYPFFTEQNISPQDRIKYVGFDADRGTNVGGTSVRGAYLSARYESRREETDFSLYDYLTGHTELNALERDITTAQKQALEKVIEQLNLRNLLQMPVANLSNGQTRRARIAKALISKPELLLLDGPFMGLDPNTSAKMSKVLKELAQTCEPRLILSLRPEDGLPEWITHAAVIDANNCVLAQGSKAEILDFQRWGANATQIQEIVRHAGSSHASQRLSRDGFAAQSPSLQPGEALVEMRGVRVTSGEKVILGDWKQNVEGEEKIGLWWNLHRGQRCGIFGANGSGKTTMLSLITSDHPQTYSLPVKLFGRSRLPEAGEPGISVFDIQKRMGHSSPEVHAFFPKQLTVRRVLESAWADGPLAKPQLTSEANKRVTAFLRWFSRELNPAQKDQTLMEQLKEASTVDLENAREIYDAALKDESDLAWTKQMSFRDLSFSNQRLILFLKSLVSEPDLVILDEATSGIDETVRDKALLFLSQGEKYDSIIDGVGTDSVLSRLGVITTEGLTHQQALLVISHAREDVPGCLREWICLPEPGEGLAPRIGVLDGPLELNTKGWDGIWGREV